MAGFTHLEAGTPESVWLDDGRALTAPLLAVDADHLVVIAAHPDDETLGAAGLMRAVHDRGGRVTVVVASDGEASHPESPTHTPQRLAGIRRVEVTRAVHEVAPGARVHFLALPDGGLREDRDALVGALRAILGALAPEQALVVAPWSGDRHRDHLVVAEAVSEVCAGLGIRHFGYPVWLWHWGSPEDVPWDAARTFVLSDDQRAAKQRALRAHESQVLPLSDASGDEAVLHASMSAHFDRPVELFFTETPDAGRQTMSSQWFDAFYARHDDPWGFETRWYEERKRAVLMASLPDRDLGAVLELGSSTGMITAQLAARADRVVAIDAAAAAIEAARRRVGEDPRVDLRQGAIPGEWPEGTFDTIVLSEVGYYLSPADLERTVERIDGSLSENGCLVACHWRHPVPEYPLTGDDVHRALRAVVGWQVLATHDEEDFILEVFVRRPARSVAEREDLR